MKPVNLIFGIFLLTLFSSCVSENYTDIKTDPSIKDRNIEVRFSIPVSSNITVPTKHSGTILINNNTKEAIEIEPLQIAETKNSSYSPIPIGSTIRVCAYKRNSAYANTIMDEFITSQAYELMDNGVLTPITVDANGVKTGISDQEMFLSNEIIDLYAYSPAIPLNTNSTVLINQNTNFITSEVLSV
ncbi:MAG: BF2992 family fimbrillin-A clan protein, partial [Bacteroidales bacterium]